MHAKTAYYVHAKQVCIICTPKSIFAYQYHEFLFLFGVLFIRIFMRPGSNFSQKCRPWSLECATRSSMYSLYCVNRFLICDVFIFFWSNTFFLYKFSGQSSPKNEILNSVTHQCIHNRMNGSIMDSSMQLIRTIQNISLFSCIINIKYFGWVTVYLL